MLSEENFKNKYLQHPISFLSEENLEELEKHCRKVSNIERGVEHKVVLELIDKYYQYQKEIQDKNNKIKNYKKENEEKDKQINLIIEYFLNELHKYTSFGGVAEFCKNKKTVECYKTKCSICIKEYFSKLSKKEGE